VRRSGIALVALVAGAAGAFVTFVIGVAATVRAECDGPCFDKWGEVVAIAIAVGAVCGLTAGWIAWERRARRSGNDQGDST
jgi:hypothetical protein